MEEAEVLCDRLAIMDHGHILEMGTVDAARSPSGSRSAPSGSTPSTASTDDDLAALPAVTRSSTTTTTSCCTPRDVAATIGALLALTEARGVEPQNLGIRRATLEDVFLDLTGRALRD